MQNRAHRLRSLLCLGSSWALLALSACTSGPMVERAEYPQDLKQARVMDIQVTRAQTQITFTNTTAQAIPPCRMWVNQWWSLDFPGMAVGETTSLDLRDFKDRFDEPFRGGGFFATEAPDALVHAQFQIGGELVGLVVISGGI